MPTRVILGTRTTTVLISSIPGYTVPVHCLVWFMPTGMSALTTRVAGYCSVLELNKLKAHIKFYSSSMTDIIMVSPARVPFPPATKKWQKKKCPVRCPMLVVGGMGEALIEET